MKRNCNLELRLLPPSEYFNPSSEFETQCPSMLNNEKGSSRIIKQHQEQHQKQMTIFYNGQMAVSDVTELQAKAIIELASRETEERLTSPISYSSSSPTTTLMQPHTPSPSSMSMKRSLQRFLQKRKNRTQAASPYHHQLAS